MTIEYNILEWIEIKAGYNPNMDLTFYEAFGNSEVKILSTCYEETLVKEIRKYVKESGIPEDKITFSTLGAPGYNDFSPEDKKSLKEKFFAKDDSF